LVSRRKYVKLRSVKSSFDCTSLKIIMKLFQATFGVRRAVLSTSAGILEKVQTALDYVEESCEPLMLPASPGNVIIREHPH